MPKQINIMVIVLSLILGLFSLSFSQESMTITTYYPSPYGSYNDLYVANRLGIGTTSLDGRLHVKSSGINTYPLTVEASDGTRLVQVRETGTGDAYLAINNNVQTNRILLYSAGDSYINGGNVGIGTWSPNVNSKLDVAGEIHSSDTSTGFFLGGGAWSDNWCRLTTDAGGTYHDLAVDNFWAAGVQRYDLAEVTPVKKEDKLEQGDTVVIDRENGLRVTRSKKPYDTFVYGIVSSYDQASMIIGGIGGPEVAMNTKEHLPVALIGRVKTKVSAENGAIQVGDLLTTSATPGHLMRCDDVSKCAGAIAGKALESLKEGKGKITVLVTLQ